MGRPWVKPSSEEMSVNGECTAYAGAMRVNKEPARAPEDSPAPVGTGRETARRTSTARTTG
jgi:hypothetical protein